MPPTGKKEHKITVVTFTLMISVALFYDGAQFLVNWLSVDVVTFIGATLAWLSSLMVDVWAFLTFYVWFKVKGVSFANPKRGLTMAGATLIELIPVLSSLPAWTLAVVICFITTRGEEVLGEALQKVGAAAGAVGTVAGVASKVPMVPPGLKQGLGEVSKAAKGLQKGAYGAREQLGSMSLADQQGFDSATRRLPARQDATAVTSKDFDEKQRAQDASAGRIDAMTDEYSKKWGAGSKEGASDTGVKQPPAAAPEAAPSSDIGGQPVFRQTPQAPQEPQPQLPDEAAKERSPEANAATASQTPPSATPEGQEKGSASGQSPQGAPQSPEADAEKKKESKKSEQGAQPERPSVSKQSAKPPRPVPAADDVPWQGRAGRSASLPETSDAPVSSGNTSPRDGHLPASRLREDAHQYPGRDERLKTPPERGSPQKPTQPGTGRTPKGGYGRFKMPTDFGGMAKQAKVYMGKRADFVKEQAAEKLRQQGLDVAEKIRRGEKLDDRPDDSVSLSA